ncbi:MAG: Rossmann-fold NAD(P)-binding domain-containing protein, partial [Planctomycetota bacterium]
MKIAIPRELHAGETRVPVIPAGVEKLTKLGAEVAVEAGLGQTIQATDAEYEKAGATVVADRTALLGEADMVLRLRPMPADEIPLLKKGAIHISFLDPFGDRELVEKIAAAGISAISMEMVPRSTRAQKMDALSSQANLAGYMTVILAAERHQKILPMM